MVRTALLYHLTPAVTDVAYTRSPHGWLPLTWIWILPWILDSYVRVRYAAATYRTPRTLPAFCAHTAVVPHLRDLRRTCLFRCHWTLRSPAATHYPLLPGYSASPPYRHTVPLPLPTCYHRLLGVRPGLYERIHSTLLRAIHTCAISRYRIYTVLPLPYTPGATVSTLYHRLPAGFIPDFPDLPAALLLRLPVTFYTTFLLNYVVQCIRCGLPRCILYVLRLFL